MAKSSRSKLFLSNSLPILLLLLAIANSCFGQRQQWDTANYPNPTAGDWQRCNMRSRSLLCDPDAVLSEQERYRVNYELGQLESSTRQDHGHDFCERKGITAAVALARRVRGGNSESTIRAMANDMLSKWSIDQQCQKAVMVVMSVEDRKFWVARMPQVPVYATELNELFKTEQENFRAGRHAQGLQNVVRGIRDRALAKQQPPPGDGRTKGTPFKPQPPVKPSRPEPGRGGGGGGFHLNWLLVLAIIFFVVIPLLCCCCCIYLCCFRKKDSGAPATDPETGGHAAPQTGGRGHGFGGLPLAGLLGGIGGAAGNFFGKNRRGGGQGPPAAGGGGAPPPYYDPVPQDDRRGQQPGGKGLYPNAPVKDEGGGGSW